MSIFKNVKDLLISYLKVRFNAKLKSFIKDDETNGYYLEIELQNGEILPYSFPYIYIDTDNINESVISIINDIDNELKRKYNLNYFYKELDNNSANKEEYIRTILAHKLDEKYNATLVKFKTNQWFPNQYHCVIERQGGTCFWVNIKKDTINFNDLDNSLNAFLKGIETQLKLDNHNLKLINDLDEVDANYLLGVVKRLANEKYTPNKVLQYSQNCFIHREENKVVLEFYL